MIRRPPRSTPKPSSAASDVYKETDVKFHHFDSTCCFARRANALLLLDDGKSCVEISQVLYLDDDTVRGWHKQYVAEGWDAVAYDGWKGGQSRLAVAQQVALCAWLKERFCRSTVEIRTYVTAQFDLRYSHSGCIKLLVRLGFEYRKPKALPRVADEAKQAAFISQYEALMNGLAADEMVVFSDAVHPEHQSRPAHGWFPMGQKTALKATSGRKRLNIQGALDLETFQFTFVEGEKINAQTTRQMLEKLERNNQTKTAIHVFIDNARYHHAKILKPWLDSPERRVKLHFLPAYAPHLNPIERLWGVMHKWVTHNRHYATFNQFTEAIFDFFRKTLPEKWPELRNTVTNNFRVVSLKEYKVI